MGEGLITPLKSIPAFVKRATADSFAISDSVWPFMDNELVRQRFGNDSESEIESDNEIVVVDVLAPRNALGEYPHRVQSIDLLQTNIPPIQRSVYVWMFSCTGIACLYYAYHFTKHPRS